MDVMLVLIAAVHIFMAPYTKVEESFNMQAIHDIIFHGHNLDKYDHLEFPGVVPRTFIGAALVSSLTSPFVTFLGLSKFSSLYAARFVLGMITLGTICFMRFELRRKFGTHVANAFAVITASQFHLLFYCSRPLPNVFALALVTLSYYFWLQNKPRTTLQLLVFATLVFRCDVLLILGPIGLSLLLTRAISFIDAFTSCCLTAIASIALSFAVDSIMWRRWVWPELEVFWFNSYHNRSSEWGISPFHWYFTSALPRAMLAAYPLCLIGLALERRLLQYVLPALCFILIYSKLPHKELRFILPALPLLNMGAAVALARIYINRSKRLWSIAYYACVLLLLASFSFTFLMAAASYANYPGGKAIAELHGRDDLNKEVQKFVHIDVLPAMTGISRFCEKGEPWRYSKQEDLSDAELRARNFTYLLSASSSVPGFRCLMAVNGFSRIRFQLRKFPLIELVSEAKIYIHGNQAFHWSARRWPGCFEYP